MIIFMFYTWEKDVFLALVCTCCLHDRISKNEHEFSMEVNSVAFIYSKSIERSLQA